MSEDYTKLFTRIDYVKVVRELDHDALQFFLNRYKDWQATDHDRGLKAPDLKVSVLRGASGNGKGKYAIETWGGGSSLFWYLVMKDCPSALVRLDVRTGLPDVEMDVILNLKAVLATANTQYNTFTYGSKSRSKAGGGIQGGQGMAVGSHKSDLRISLYKKPQQTAAYEIQCSGAMLARIMKEAKVALYEGAFMDACEGVIASIVKKGAHRLREVPEFADCMAFETGLDFRVSYYEKNYTHVAKFTGDRSVQSVDMFDGTLKPAKPRK